MNRRQFTASLAALAATPALPLAARAAAPAATALPPGSYLFAELIARAQNTCSPALLAKHLRLDAATARQLFGQLVTDGVIKAPSAAGIAQATRPLPAPTAHIAPAARPFPTKPSSPLNTLKNTVQPTDPLVKEPDPRLGCDSAQTKDTFDASPDKPVQESPQAG